jgi:hypothetical protein
MFRFPSLHEYLEIRVVRGAWLATHGIRDPPDDDVGDTVLFQEGIYLS